MGAPEKARKPHPDQLDGLLGLLAATPGKRTTRAWIQLQPLSDILRRKQVNVVKRLLHPWCTNLNRSKVQAMKAVAMARSACRLTPGRYTTGVRPLRFRLPAGLDQWRLEARWLVPYGFPADTRLRPPARAPAGEVV